MSPHTAVSSGRDKLRKWLSAGYAAEVAQWIEVEIENLDRMVEREETDDNA